MKRPLITIGLLFLLIAGAAAAERTMLARVTVYWAGAGSDHWSRNHQAATNVRLHNGHCAVDPRRIPYGSKVRIADETLTAVDTGKHVQTRRAARRTGRTEAERNAIVIDRFFETKEQALAWAKRHPHFMTVAVSMPNKSIVETTTTTTTSTVRTKPPNKIATRTSTVRQTTTTRIATSFTASAAIRAKAMTTPAPPSAAKQLPRALDSSPKLAANTPRANIATPNAEVRTRWRRSLN